MTIVNTVCKDCVFAIKNKGNQTGCQLGRLEKFKSLGQAKKTGKSYTISRLCNRCRNSDWLKTCKPEDPVKEVIKETQLSYDVIIYELSNSSLQYIQNSLKVSFDSLFNQAIKPKKVIVYLDNDENIGPELFKFAKQQPLFKAVEWVEIKTCLDGDPVEDADSVFAAIDIVLKHITSQYYTVLRNGDILDEEYAATLDYWLNEELRRFLVVKPGDTYLSCFTCQKLIHSKLGGSLPKYSIIERIEDATKVTNSGHLICTYPK